MLNYLSIKNVSVIESVSFELNKGMNTLTGETGAGKSVMIGAFKLLLGGRFQRDMLRERASKLSVEAIFDNVGHIPQDLREQYNIDEELSIRREVDDTGKNKVSVNGKMASVTELKSFAPYLADIHGQHEHQVLLDESRHINFIDHIVARELRDAYSTAFKAYKVAKDEHRALLESIEDLRKNREIAEFQLDEIRRANIAIDDDKELPNRVQFLSNIENIRLAASASLDDISEGESNAVGFVSKAIRALEPFAALTGEVSPILESLTLAVDSLGSASKELSAMLDKQDVSPVELDRLVQRKYMLQDLMRKHGGTLEAVVSKGSELAGRLKDFVDSDGLAEKLAARGEELRITAQKIADELNTERRKAAAQISAQVVEILNELELPNSKFLTVFVDKDELDERGGIEAKFHISVNKGFEPAPLAHVASGGEISRVMLALKEVFSESDSVATLIFDEIDTGISGVTAKRVAERLIHLAKKKQVLVITHLPVVAAKGDAQYYIEKGTDGDTARTTIRLLGSDERKNIVAKMIAGEVSETSIQQAQELLNN
ncbi:DNA repair protein RecN [Deferribacterales bacterium RsTz2092]|nr:DNA repair protein RecN [Deferribacterales bacterium]